MKKLLVKVNGTAMVTNIEALDAGIRRYIGRVWDSSLADKENGIDGGWRPTDEPEEVPFRAEYVRDVKEGALLPCDKETAELCNVPFTAQ